MCQKVEELYVNKGTDRYILGNPESSSKIGETSTETGTEGTCVDVMSRIV